MAPTTEEALPEEEEPIEAEGDYQELEDPALETTVEHPDDLYNAEDNPLNPVGDRLDLLIQVQMNDDLWQAMLGDLPCLEPTEACIAELQQQAVESSLTLQLINERVTAINERIEEARARNQDTVWMDTFEPLMQRYLSLDTVTTPTGQTQQRGFFDHLLSAFSNPLGAINEALSLIGIPLVRGITQTNARAQQTAIAISDLQVKVAQIEQEQRKVEQAIREEVVMQVLDFDQGRREFQISQEIARRSVTQHQLLEIDYRFSDQIDSVAYLGNLSELDQRKAATYREWAKLRSQLARIKILVLGVPE